MKPLKLTEYGLHSAPSMYLPLCGPHLFIIYPNLAKPVKSKYSLHSVSLRMETWADPMQNLHISETHQLHTAIHLKGKIFINTSEVFNIQCT